MTRLLLALAAMAALLFGCGRAAGPAQPPTIRYGVDVSAECGMIIDDPRFAVAAIPESGAPLFFDDLGDFLSYRRSRQTRLSAVFVHDYHTKEWVAAERAWYLASPKIATPMDAGLASFANEDGARGEQGQVGGQVLTWTEVLDRPAPSN